VSLPVRRLGAGGPTVSALGLGCMGMSQAYSPPIEDGESIRTIHRALELGVTFFDTADAYGEGVNETLVGAALGRHRHEVILATKCGLVRGTDGQATGVDGSPAHVQAACDASLQRLGTDVIDLYYLHRVDPTVPVEESVGAMAALVQAGKVRYLGLSEVAPGTLRRAHAVHAITALQSEYSLWVREPEAAVLPTCQELGVAFVPFSPLGRGFLSGRLVTTDGLSDADLRHKLPRFQGAHAEHNLGLVHRLEALARARKCTAAQLSLAWLLSKGPDIVPIPGTKRRSYLEANLAAIEIALDTEALTAIEQIFPPGAASGNRYHEAMMRLVDPAFLEERQL
jgi:aryl-alcohol dehydrogenase-like predicted oxidoreductase